MEEIHEYMPERRVVEGGQLSLPCHAEAYPIPTKDWSKDGGRLYQTPGRLIHSYGCSLLKVNVKVYFGCFCCAMSNMYSALLGFVLAFFLSHSAKLKDYEIRGFGKH